MPVLALGGVAVFSSQRHLKLREIKQIQDTEGLTELTFFSSFFGRSKKVFNAAGCARHVKKMRFYLTKKRATPVSQDGRQTKTLMVTFVLFIVLLYDNNHIA